MTRRINIADIDFSKPRVRYKGEVQDKCSLSGLIHDTAFMLGNTSWPLWSDIYWDTARYDELRDRLIKNVNALKQKEDNENKSNTNKT